MADCFVQAAAGHLQAPCPRPSAALPTPAALRCALRPQAARRAELLAAGKAGKEEKLAAARKAKAAARPGVKKVSKAFYNTMITDSGEHSKGTAFCSSHSLEAPLVGRGLDPWAGWASRVRLDWLGCGSLVFAARVLESSLKLETGALGGLLDGMRRHAAARRVWLPCAAPLPAWVRKPWNPDCPRLGCTPPAGPSPLPVCPALPLLHADYVGEDYEVFSTWLGTTQ